jgi:hypothetical protein
MIRATLVILVLLATALPWNGATHSYICGLAGISADCVSADGDVNARYHACRGNASDCPAREKARYYLEDYNKSGNTTSLGYAAHLFADSMTPAHWYSLDYDKCHGVFEEKVGKYVGKGVAGWSVSLNCTAKTGENVTLFADEAYLGIVAGYVRNQMSVTDGYLMPALLSIIALLSAAIFFKFRRAKGKG